MRSCVTNVADNKKVITVDIPSAFLQGDWLQNKYYGYIMFEGIIVDITCEINLLFDNIIIWSKNCKKKFLYSHLIKAVYGTLLGTIVFYNKLS